MTGLAAPTDQGQISRREVLVLFWSPNAAGFMLARYGLAKIRDEANRLPGG
jgi:hypothetical protein